MPSLVAFGRRWNISSDDFVFPELTEAFARLVWIVLAVVVFLLHQPFTCDSPKWFVYIFVMIAINLTSAMFCFMISTHSAKGSLLDMGARRYVVPLLYMRVPLFAAELFWVVIMTVMASGEIDVKSCFSLRALRIAVLLEWILIFAVAMGVILIFNSQGHSREELILQERRSWRKKLMLCKICQNDDMRTVIDDIAFLLASFFADNDFVLSDIVAGLLLLVHSPHIRPPAGEIRDSGDLEKCPDWMRMPNCLAKASRMFDIAMAIYGWPTYLFHNCGCCGCLSCIRLLSKARLRRLNNVIVLDNCCSCHTGAFLLEAECKESDLFMVCFRNRLFQVPFIVLADHITKSVVVAIRGSASFSDFFTDLSLNDDIFSVDADKDSVLRKDSALDDDENGNEVRVHRGMLRAARYVYDKLMEYNVLDNVMANYPEYHLAICGHSLGAGIASLLTLLLKQSNPDVRCYAFSPPGCVISKNGLAETEKHVLSVFLSDDVIPRISLQSIQLLKANINREIFSTTKAKYEILIKGVFKLFFSSLFDLHDGGSIDSGSFSRDQRWLIENRENYGAQSTVEDSLSSMNARNLSGEAFNNGVFSNERRIQLYPPGRLLCLRYKQYDHVRMNWVDVDYLSEIQLTSSMLADHWPMKVRKVLRQAVKESIINV